LRHPRDGNDLALAQLVGVRHRLRGLALRACGLLVIRDASSVVIVGKVFSRLCILIHVFEEAILRLL
jgi:hypothetical protein